MGMYFSVFSFCLILSVYFYILSRSDTFPDLGGMPCVRDILPSIRGPELYALGSLNIGCVGPPVLMRPTSVGMLAGGPGPWPGWVPGLALCGGCWPTDGSIWVWGSPELVLVHWWVRPCPGAANCRTGGPCVWCMPASWWVSPQH